MKTKLFRKINLPPLGGGLGWGLLTLLLLFGAGCKKDDDLSGGQGITLTVALLDNPDYNYNVTFAVTAQRLIIDWGDGSASETYTNITAQFNDWDYPLPNIIHTYIGSGAYTVQIKGEGLTHFDCNSDYDYHAHERSQALIHLDVSKCPALQVLYCFNNHLTSLDVSKCPALQDLYCHDNQLTSLDVSKCPALQTLVCGENQLTSLDVSKCPALQTLSCNSNQLISLDVSKCLALQWLNCQHNQLTSLNVSGCAVLQDLGCQVNQLTSLNVNGCAVLQELNCIYNQLTSLNVSGCTALQKLDCYNNQLTSLNISGCLALQMLQCQNNQLIVTALNTVFTTLPSRAQSDGRIHINNNPGAGACNRAIAQNKGWSFD